MNGHHPHTSDAVIHHLRATLTQRAGDHTITPAFTARVQRLRRRRHLTLRAVQITAVLAVVAVLGAGIYQTLRPTRQLEFISPPATASPTPQPSAPQPSPSPSTSDETAPTEQTSAPAAQEAPSPPPASGLTVPPGSVDAPEAAAARAFVEAVAEGDFATAWDLLGPRSQEVLGSRAALEEERSALAEGWGAWASAPDAVIFHAATLASSGEGRLSIVTFTGTLTQEGTTGLRTVAAPAWVENDSDDPADGRFEPFAPGDVPLIINDPVEAGTVACADVAVSAEGPMEFDSAVASLDGDLMFTPNLDTELAEPGLITFPVESPPSPGEHVLTFGLVTDQGTPYADAVRFTVEGPC
jgi:hypothetical protein